MLVELWPRIHNKVIAEREDVDRAITLSAQLQKALALHEAEKSPLLKPTSRRHLRAQAFTLFYRAYEETRRGVSFLRWYEGDAQTIVPTLYMRRPRRPSANGSEARVDTNRSSVDEPPPSSPVAANEAATTATTE